ncbi:jg12407 [Pararge aegeria aegeria]|uniref:Jg12407 protein n=1 Tax=Pararge aegeria aegeria TaxID=348720 RepID=A0A8S4S7N7_9NEOP|nr:jg12407 [Pararge aegeria aegeria]
MVTAGQGVSRISGRDSAAKPDYWTWQRTYNARTLRTDEKLVELEEAVSKLRWSIMGLSEVRREGEDTIILKSGNLFYNREGEQQSQGGVGFIVHKSLVNNIVRVESVSSRVAYLVLRVTKRYSLKVIEVYAPTTAHSDKEVEALYEDISKAIHTSKTYYSVVMGDYNARLGKRSGAELRVGQFGYGQRNERGQMLADFMEKEGLFMMNSFFESGRTGNGPG